MEEKQGLKKPSSEEEKRGAVILDDVVTKVLPNDILLGRGALAIGNEGNVRFRSLIKERKVEYMSTSRRKMKDVIAGNVRAEIARRNGRFIRRTELTNHQYEALGLPKGTDGKLYKPIALSFSALVFFSKVWVKADEETVIQKIKQSLRDKEAESSSKRSPWAASEDSALSVSRISDSRDTKRQRTEPSASISAALGTNTGTGSGASLAHPFSLSNLSQNVASGHQQNPLSQTMNSPGASLIQGIDPRVIAALSASLQQGSLQSQGAFLSPPAQQQFLNLAQQSALLDQINATRQEGERQMLMRRIQEEQAASILRMQQQQQNPYLAALRFGGAAPTFPGATSAFVRSSLGQVNTVPPPASLQAFLQAQQNMSLLPAMPPTVAALAEVAAARPNVDTDTEKESDDESAEEEQPVKRSPDA